MKQILRTLIAKNYFNPPNSLKQQLYRPIFWGLGKDTLVDRTLSFLSKDDMHRLDKMYELLSDDQSKDLMIRLLASRALGEKGSSILPLHGQFNKENYENLSTNACKVNS